MKVTVNRKAHFNAAHRLYQNDWTDKQNQAVYGKCSNQNFHGHNYEIIASVTGKINPKTGYVIDMKLLKHILKTEIEDAFDHKNLNLDVPEFKNLIPTAENIVVIAYQKIKTKLPDNLDLEVTLYETPRNFVTYNGL